MIRALHSDDAAAYFALRRHALLDAPLAFATSPEDDFASSKDAIRDYFRRGALFGAFDGETLVGAVGLFRDRHVKAAHKAHVWGMYVMPSHRGQGLGAQLLEAAIAHARELGVAAIHLGVTDAAPEARRLYERAGFKVWGTQPDALRHEGVSASELHMVLDA